MRCLRNGIIFVFPEIWRGFLLGFLGRNEEPPPLATIVEPMRTEIVIDCPAAPVSRKSFLKFAASGVLPKGQFFKSAATLGNIDVLAFRSEPRLRLISKPMVQMGSGVAPAGWSCDLSARAFSAK